ncbi:cupin domain-containing protein [Mesorhizobium sp. B2-1-3A]|uniref:cupin domain-containing protein n=1 Tax=Mesorhizobium sp. B2-1-3A TaxID=2589971 RepID=UPI001FED7919|nr:cupin domain-containing protein [Mesorhizobium sp. B2-1-3A]
MQAVKALKGRLTGGRPGDVTAFVTPRKANTMRFADDGLIPNHPAWPLLIYRTPVALSKSLDPAAVMEAVFETNGWGDSWRNGIYPYVHYHSRIHEVLGVARGKASVRFGGEKGRTILLKAGDVAVLPAGTGHQCQAASDDFLVVGAYPPFGTYDECTKPKQHEAALHSIAALPPAETDPVFGTKGPLIELWRS